MDHMAQRKIIRIWKTKSASNHKENLSVFLSQFCSNLSKADFLFL